MATPSACAETNPIARLRVSEEIQSVFPGQKTQDQEQHRQQDGDSGADGGVAGLHAGILSRCAESGSRGVVRYNEVARDGIVKVRPRSV